MVSASSAFDIVSLPDIVPLAEPEGVYVVFYATIIADFVVRTDKKFLNGRIFLKSGWELRLRSGFGVRIECGHEERFFVAEIEERFLSA
jgi:hypothetical protein